MGEEEAELELPFSASEQHAEEHAEEQFLPNWQVRSQKAAVDAVRRNQERWPLWAKRVDYHAERQPAGSYRSPKASRAHFTDGGSQELEQCGQRPATRRPQPPPNVAWGDMD